MPWTGFITDLTQTSEHVHEYYTQSCVAHNPALFKYACLRTHDYSHPHKHMHAINTAFYMRRCAAFTHIASLWFVCVCKRSYKHVILLKLSFFPLHPHSHPHFSFLQRDWDFQAAQMERVVVDIVQMVLSL